LEGAEGERSERRDRNVRGQRRRELQGEYRDRARWVSVERRVDDTKVTALYRRSAGVAGGVGIGDDGEVAVRVQQRAVLCQEQDKRKAESSQ